MENKTVILDPDKLNGLIAKNLWYEKSIAKLCEYFVVNMNKDNCFNLIYNNWIF